MAGFGDLGAFAKKAASSAAKPAKKATTTTVKPKQNTYSDTAKWNPNAPVSQASGAPAPYKPKAAVAPATSSGGGSSSGGSGSGSGSGGGSGYSTAAAVSAPVVEVPEVVKPPSDKDWLAEDSAYGVESAGLKSTLDTALAALKAQRQSYSQDALTSFNNLGLKTDGINPNASLNDLVTSYGNAGWDADNQLGAYGQGLSNINNDFAGRGMLDSSFYEEGRGNFQQGMNDQRQNALTALSDYFTQNGDNTGQGSAARSEYSNALSRAKENSFGRRDAKYGTV